MNKRKDYKAALALRLQGKSYGEIKSLFGIPKSTLSSWFSDVELEDNVKKILESKKKNGYLQLIKFNKERTFNIKKENESIRNDYKSRISKLSNYELMILGAGLYWGEGYKNFNSQRFSYPYLCFGNSDPKMILVFMIFLNKVMNVSNDRIKAQVMIYPNLDSGKCVKYWQNITKIPKNNFRCQISISRASRRKRPQNLLPYGTLQLRVNQRQEFFKVMGLIDGIIKVTGS